MRLLLINHNADLYGASRSLLRLATRLVRDGHETRVFLPVDGPLREALEQAGATVETVRGLPIIERSAFASPRGLAALSLRYPRSVAALRRAIGAYAPDIVHTNTSVIPTPGVAARVARVPHVWHIREFYTEFAPFWRIYRRYMTAFATRVVCVSRAVARQFGEEGTPARRRVAVLHNGFPLEEFAPVDAGRIRAFRDAHGLGDAPLVGVVGRLKLRRKGQETFIDACARLADRHPAARFPIVGSAYAGNEAHRDALERLAAERGLTGRVVFTGDIADIKAAYAAMDVVVLPSGLPEPFGGVVIEAMAMGKPVIGTNIGGTPEQIADRRTGLLVAPGDPDALAAAMNRLLSDAALRGTMGAAGRTRYLEHFEFEPFYRGLLGIYEQARAPETHL